MSGGRNNTNEVNSGGGAQTFLELNDVYESTYAGNQNSYVVVNNAGSGLVFNDTPPTGATAFTQLSDCPNFINANQYVIGNSSATALTYTASAPPASFLSLTDTPNTYVAQANKTLQVNGAENAIVFNTVLAPQTAVFTGGFSDVPSSVGTDGQVLTASGGSTVFATPTAIPTELFSGDYTDAPSSLGTDGQMLAVSGSTTIFQTPVTQFLQLSNCPSSFSGESGKVCAVNMAENAIEFVSPTFAEAFLNLIDCPSSYETFASTYVKVKSTQDGLEFVPGGSGTDSLITLTDNTAGTYTTDNINMAVAINNDASGFKYLNTAYMQSGIPRLVQGMIKGYRNYPNNTTFDYNSSDAENGQYFYFGTHRTNYNEPRFLNSYWTSSQPTGGSNFYAIVGSDTTLDLDPKYVGIGSTAHSCGVNLKVNNTINIVSPYNTWFMDVLVNVSWRIDIGNIDDNIYVMYICSKAQMDALVNTGLDFDLVKGADYFWVNENGQDSTLRNYPNSISEGHISKIITLPLGSGTTYPDINVFMCARNKSDYSIKGTFTIRSYYYINCSYSIVGFRAPQPGVDRPSLSNSLPGLFW